MAKYIIENIETGDLFRTDNVSIHGRPNRFVEFWVWLSPYKKIFFSIEEVNIRIYKLESSE